MSSSSAFGSSGSGSSPASPLSTLTFHFVSMSLSILNCSVYGPQSRKYFDVVTNDEVAGHTFLYDHDCQIRAVIDWELEHPEVEVRGVVARQLVTQWMTLSETKSYRLMEAQGRQYEWSPQGNAICLYKVGKSAPSEMFAQISRKDGTVTLDMTPQALHAGLLETLVIATLLFQSGLPDHLLTITIIYVQQGPFRGIPDDVGRLLNALLGRRLVMKMSVDLLANQIPGNVLHTIIRHILSIYTSVDMKPTDHYCSLDHPCRIVFAILSPFFDLRLVASSWNSGIKNTLQSLRPTSGSGDSFFKRVEDAYYPHPWHINTKVRKYVLLRRYRVHHTISDRGVYLAYNFGTLPAGCLDANEVVIKAWSDPRDRECVTEASVYQTLDKLTGVPDVKANMYDPHCSVYVIVLQKLGPTLEDLMRAMPEGRFNEKMVLGVAIQMLDRYKNVHSRGIIHNGMKPANICLPPPRRPTFISHPDLDQDTRDTDIGRGASTLYPIDFGLSSFLSPDETQPSDRRADTIGNRCFLSVFGHHGITQSQRDDLESLAYLLSFLRHGYLPWSAPPPPTVQSHATEPAHKLHFCPNSSLPSYVSPQVWRLKTSTPASVLFKGMDDEFVEFFRVVKGLAFNEVPDYDAMKGRFEDCWRRRGFNADGSQTGKVDWWAIWKAVQGEEI
ncbi:Casein kinase I isoform alpha [Hypsizygus marmoreus]|uniref:Casein kinase I isoform alpha n=1 Tax=Hypsizygus marmoreus TaxID=39966 RepID=A0A369JBL4_HYPMA|nr:Casein kinase I isoform alpha [Hypsizygus marmoreus]